MRTNSTEELLENIVYTDDPESNGPAMQALQPKERAFVHFVVNVRMPYATAAKEAGFGRAADGSQRDARAMASFAWRLRNRPRILDALREETAKLLKGAGPAAAHAIGEILQDFRHKDRAKVALALAERVEPTVQKFEGRVDHVHHVDHAAEELNQFRTLKALAVAREKLIEVFGEFGLERIEKRAALEDKRSVPMNTTKDAIDADYVEVTPAHDPDFNPDGSFKE